MIVSLFRGLGMRVSLFLLFSAVPALLLIFYAASEEHRTELGHVRSDALNAAALAAKHHERLIRESHGLLATLSHFPQVREGGAELCASVLEEVMSRYPSCSSLVLTGPAGEVLCSTVDRKGDATPGPVPAGEVESNGYRNGDAPAELRFTLAFPVMGNDGTRRGVLHAALDTGWIEAFAGEYGLPEGSAILVFNPDGDVLGASGPRPSGDGMLRSTPLLEAALAGRQEAVEMTDQDGVVRLYAFALMPGTFGQKLFVGVGIPEVRALAGISSVMPHSLIGALVLLVVTSAWVVGDSSLFRRIRMLKDRTAQIAGGDLSVRAREAENRQGAFGELFESFNDMARRLEERDAQLRLSEAKYRMMVERIPSVTYKATFDRGFSPLYVSPNMENLLGGRYEDWLSDSSLWLERIHPDDRERVSKEIARSMAEELPLVCEYRMLHSDGRVVWVRNEATAIREGDEGRLSIHGVLHDITRDKEADKSMLRLNRTLKTLSACNQVLIHATEESDLLHRICSVIVNEGEYRMAWVGLAEEGQEKIVRPLAHAGFMDGYLDIVRITWDDTETGLGLTGMAIKTGEVRVMKDVASESNYDYWRAEAKKRGYNSSISLPLSLDGLGFGALTIYSSEPSAFDDDEITLLGELTDDLAFGLATLRTGRERDRVQEELRHAHETMNQIFETAGNGMCVVDKNYYVLKVNATFARIMNIDKEKAVGRKCHELCPGSHCHTSACTLLRILQGDERVEYEDERVVSHAQTVPCSITATPLRNPDGELLGAVIDFKDIRNIRHAEVKLEETMNNLRRAMDGTIQAMALTVEMRDPYTAGHQRRVADLACAIGREMRLSESQLEGIRVAGLIHDIGKICVPAEILSKPGKINEFEFGIIKTHTQVGYDILKSVDFPWPIAQIVYQHHERMNGSGYPRGLYGEEILLEARILAAADVIEAMASHRPYRPALGVEKALEAIESGRGNLYDPDVAEACLRLFRSEGLVKQLLRE
ncbi:MAG: HD domain-containing phosphohydrolase [Acidobacteriota bacterium]